MDLGRCQYRAGQLGLGALGIILKLGLLETIAVIVIGNIIGCAIFAAFTVMGHKTGVNQMVLTRSAFGVRGAYLPSILMFLMTLGWIGVNTYFPVKIAVAILGQFGIPDTFVIQLIVITLVMVLQVGIGVYGFYAIRTFEKYTVPVTAVIMVLMSVLAWTRPGVVNWGLTTSLPPGAHLAMITLLMTAIGVGWGISWVTWASDYSRFVPRSVPSRFIARHRRPTRYRRPVSACAWQYSRSSRYHRRRVVGIGCSCPPSASRIRSTIASSSSGP